ncbi:MAG: helix-turn-helix domain-containing protein [Bacteroidales bacterium]|jgi:AraC-like DNA-binding protein|nr:helix-turn-helix domain-containing protein [Bacteroidales bacterium]
MSCNNGKHPGREILEDLAKRILDAVYGKHLYLNPEMKLTDLVNEVGSNRTYVSSVFPRIFGTNFREFINSVRLEYAESFIKGLNERKSDDKCLNMEDIAIISGFGDKRTLYNAMKRNKVDISSLLKEEKNRGKVK